MSCIVTKHGDGHFGTSVVLNTRLVANTYTVQYSSQSTIISSNRCFGIEPLRDRDNFVQDMERVMT